VGGQTSALTAESLAFGHSSEAAGAERLVTRRGAAKRSSPGTGLTRRGAEATGSTRQIQSRSGSRRFVCSVWDRIDPHQSRIKIELPARVVREPVAACIGVDAQKRNRFVGVSKGLHRAKVPHRERCVQPKSGSRRRSHREWNLVTEHASNQSSVVEATTPIPGSRAGRNLYPKSRSGTNCVCSRMTKKLARASLWASASRATITLVLLALRW
jgi:hypothetical protein